MTDDASAWVPKEVLQVNADSQVLTEKFTAIASQTLFVLKSFSYAPNTHSLLVFKKSSGSDGGELLIPDIDVFEDSTTQFHIALPASAGDVYIALGWIGVTGIASEAPAAGDFFMATKAILQAYTGPITYIYLLGISSAGDGGEGWYRKVTGEATGTFLDNNQYHILTTVGGDGSAAWVKTSGIEQMYSNGVAVTYISATSFSIVQAELPTYGPDSGSRVRFVDGETPLYSTIVSFSSSGGVTTFVIKDTANQNGAVATYSSGYKTVIFSKLNMDEKSPLYLGARPVRYAKATGTVDIIVATFIPKVYHNDDAIICLELSGSITSTTPTLNVDTRGAKTIVKGNNAALALADMAGTNRRCLFSFDTGLDKWVLLNPAIADVPLSRGALVYLGTTQAIPNNTITEIAFDTEVYDTDNIHDNVTNNTRLTVPAGVTRVQLSAQCKYVANSTGFRSLNIFKDNIGFAGAPSLTINGNSSTAAHLPISTPELVVVGGDYFEVATTQNSGGSLDIADTAGESVWFAMKIIR